MNVPRQQPPPGTASRRLLSDPTLSIKFFYRQANKLLIYSRPDATPYLRRALKTGHFGDGTMGQRTSGPRFSDSIDELFDPVLSDAIEDQFFRCVAPLCASKWRKNGLAFPLVSLRTPESDRLLAFLTSWRALASHKACPLCKRLVASGCPIKRRLCKGRALEPPARAKRRR